MQLVHGYRDVVSLNINLIGFKQFHKEGLKYAEEVFRQN